MDCAWTILGGRVNLTGMAQPDRTFNDLPVLMLADCVSAGLTALLRLELDNRGKVVS